MVRFVTCLCYSLVLSALGRGLYRLIFSRFDSICCLVPCKFRLPVSPFLFPRHF